MVRTIWRHVLFCNGSCADPGIFVGGGGGGGGVQVSLTKSSDNGFFFKEIYHFSRFQRGSNIFQEGSNFFQGGGSNSLFPIETHITCAFPGGGGVRTPCPPLLDLHLRLIF